MRTLRLGRQFDAVFVHDAICYMTSENDLRRAIETAYVHCLPGGAAVFAPDHVRETFTPSTDHGGHDDGARGLRYLEWTWDPNPSDATYVVEYAYLLRERDGDRLGGDETALGIRLEATLDHVQKLGRRVRALLGEPRVAGSVATDASRSPGHDGPRMSSAG